MRLTRALFLVAAITIPASWTFAHAGDEMGMGGSGGDMKKPMKKKKKGGDMGDSKGDMDKK